MKVTSFTSPYLGRLSQFQAMIIICGLFAASIITFRYNGPLAAVAVSAAFLVVYFLSVEQALFLFLATTLLCPSTILWRFGNLDWNLSRIAFVLLVVIWILALSSKKIQLKRTPLDLAIVFFIGALFISIMVNGFHMNSDQFDRALKTFGYILLEWFALYYITATIPKNRQQIRKIFIIILFMVTIVAIVGIFEFITDIRIYEWVVKWLPGGDSMRPYISEYKVTNRTGGYLRGGILRIVSTTISPHEVGTLMAMSLPLALYFAAYARSVRNKYLWIIAIVAMVTALFLAVTRGAIIAAVVGLICLSLLSRKKFLRTAFLVVCAAILLTFIYIPALPNAFLSVSEPAAIAQDASVQDRTADWPQAVELLKGSELSGIGLAIVTEHQLDYGRTVSQQFKYTDNYYLATAVESGVLGLGALLLIWGAIFVFLTRRVRRADIRGNERRDLRIAILSSASAFMVMCFSFDALAFITVTKIFWIVVALGAALTLADRTEPVYNPSAFETGILPQI